MKRSQVLLERTSSIGIGYDPTGMCRLRIAQDRPKVCPAFHPLTCLRQSPTDLIFCKSCVFAVKPAQRLIFDGHTVIGTHSRFTRQLLGYSQRLWLARGELYDLQGSRILGSGGKTEEINGPSQARPVLSQGLKPFLLWRMRYHNASQPLKSCVPSAFALVSP
jgi:hypothetical protein